MTWSDTTSLSSFVLMDVLVSTDLSETLQLVLLLYPSVIDSDQSRVSGGCPEICCVVTKKVYVLFIITEKARTKEEMSVYVCLFSSE